MHVEGHAAGGVVGDVLCVCGLLVEELQHILFDY